MIGSWIRANSQSPKSGHLRLNWTNLQDFQVLFLILLLIVKNQKKKKKRSVRSSNWKIRIFEYNLCIMNITAAQIELSDLRSTFLRTFNVKLWLILNWTTKGMILLIRSPIRKVMNARMIYTTTAEYATVKFDWIVKGPDSNVFQF